MTEPAGWGIFRERLHSPGREADDAEILRLTAKTLEARGFQVTLKDPAELTIGAPPPPQFVLLMCEQADTLRRLRRWERLGTRLLNAPAAVLGTYRDRMLAAWRRARVPFPRSRLVRTHTPVRAAPMPVWVKRGDVHNTQDGDVVFADTVAAARGALQALAHRGIPRAVVQTHVDGDLVKFYGIGRVGRRVDDPAAWFRWFYHRGQRVVGHPFDPACLAALAGRAAAAVGLEVFGGDVLVAGPGVLQLIDLNAWPSFARYREEAAVVIASYLETALLAARREERP